MMMESTPTTTTTTTNTIIPKDTVMDSSWKHDNSNSSSSSSAPPPPQDDDLYHAKEHLRQSMVSRQHRLSVMERNFLQDLVDHTLSSSSTTATNTTTNNETVSLQALLQATKVLEHDPLFNNDHDSNKKGDDTTGTNNNHNVNATLDPHEESTLSIQHQQQHYHHHDAFRREVWTHYTSRWFVDKQQQQQPQDEMEDDDHHNNEKTKGRTSTNHDKHKKKQRNRIASFFGRIFAGDHQDKNRSQTEQLQKDKDDRTVATTIIAEPLPVFCVLATSVDNQEVTPHVLCPPLMDALRPYLPYAVQEDNYWLKYSLMRDVSIFLYYQRVGCEYNFYVSPTTGCVERENVCMYYYHITCLCTAPIYLIHSFLFFIFFFFFLIPSGSICVQLVTLCP
jgi:hypothetical protein